MRTEIEKITHSSDGIVYLFDCYRQFYNKEGDYWGTKRYVDAQLLRGTTTILVVKARSGMLGFIQFGHRHCSCAGKVLLLNDLFVEPGSRNMGIGRELMEAALDYGKAEGASVVELETEIDNKAGQHLYESLGYKRDRRYVTYTRGME
jgi:ribosomal protein S18 acetylase RimI-like enzyme